MITLLTDFGYRDHYVASMKGVILSIAGDVTIVDISHGVPKFDVRAAAYVLGCAYKYFPPGTVHVVVVDPGVGTKRRAIAVRSKHYTFIGPDNGVLMLAALNDGLQKVVSIENRKYMLPRVSHTFHGRDIFAPAAAYLAKGVPLEELGPEINDYLVPEFAKPMVRRGEAEGEVIYVDDFGNCATNIRERDLEILGANYGDELELNVSGRTLRVKLLPSFGWAKPGEPLLLINSEGFLEIAINLGNASSSLGIKPGEKVYVRVHES